MELLQNSLMAWRQLEYGLSEFQQVLGKDRGTLQGLEGALNKGQTSANELVQNVKLVAKLLSENVQVSQEQLTAAHEHLDPNHILHITKFTSSSNGSLSDSGISDGGATSDGGLSERERRLGVLRRLAKQLESALAPGSEAMKSIAARMESAEAELKSLQNTCRDLIVRTATTHQNQQKQLQQQQQQQQQQLNSNGHLRNSSKIGNGVQKKQQHNHQQQNGKSNQKLKGQQQKMKSQGSRVSPDGSEDAEEEAALKMMRKVNGSAKRLGANGSREAYEASQLDLDSSEEDQPHQMNGDQSGSDNDEVGVGPNGQKKKGWGWRIARVAVPVQLALCTAVYAACMMQPNCCDNLNNFSMSFAPQLHYVRGPPPI